MALLTLYITISRNVWKYHYQRLLCDFYLNHNAASLNSYISYNIM